MKLPPRSGRARRRPLGGSRVRRAPKPGGRRVLSTGEPGGAWSRVQDGGRGRPRGNPLALPQPQPGPLPGVPNPRASRRAQRHRSCCGKWPGPRAGPGRRGGPGCGGCTGPGPRPLPAPRLPRPRAPRSAAGPLRRGAPGGPRSGGGDRGDLRRREGDLGRRRGWGMWGAARPRAGASALTCSRRHLLVARASPASPPRPRSGRCAPRPWARPGPASGPQRVRRPPPPAPIPPPSALRPRPRRRRHFLCAAIPQFRRRARGGRGTRGGDARGDTGGGSGGATRGGRGGRKRGGHGGTRARREAWAGCGAWVGSANGRGWGPGWGRGADGPGPRGARGSGRSGLNGGSWRRTRLGSREGSHGRGRGQRRQRGPGRGVRPGGASELCLGPGISLARVSCGRREVSGASSSPRRPGLRVAVRGRRAAGSVRTALRAAAPRKDRVSAHVLRPWTYS